MDTLQTLNDVITFIAQEQQAITDNSATDVDMFAWDVLMDLRIKLRAASVVATFAAAAQQIVVPSAPVPTRAEGDGCGLRFKQGDMAVVIDDGDGDPINGHVVEVIDDVPTAYDYEVEDVLHHTALVYDRELMPLPKAELTAADTATALIAQVRDVLPDDNFTCIYCWTGKMQFERKNGTVYTYRCNNCSTFLKGDWTTFASDAEPPDTAPGKATVRLSKAQREALTVLLQNDMVVDQRGNYWKGGIMWGFHARSVTIKKLIGNCLISLISNSHPREYEINDAGRAALTEQR